MQAPVQAEAGAFRRNFPEAARRARRLREVAVLRYGRLRLGLRPKNAPCRIIVGACETIYGGWVPTDRRFLDLLDERSFARFFEPGSITAVLAEHVWEHLTPEQGLHAARLCHRYLMPGGRLRVAVPDGNHPDRDYIADVRPGGSGSCADDHKALYTVSTFADLFERAGFEVSPLEFFDARQRFHRHEWSVRDGFVRRSAAFDPRNKATPLAYTSLIMDAIKPERPATRRRAP